MVVVATNKIWYNAFSCPPRPTSRSAGVITRVALISIAAFQLIYGLHFSNLLWYSGSASLMDFLDAATVEVDTGALMMSRHSLVERALTLANSSGDDGVTTAAELQSNDDEGGHHDNNNEPCWTILWLVPDRWEKVYFDDMLTGLPLCDRSNNDDGTSTANKQARLRYKPGMLDLNATYFERTILVTSIRMGNRVHNQDVMDAFDSLSYNYVIFLISEESDPQSPVCTAPSSTTTPFRDMMNRSALVVRNYWVADCQTFADDKIFFAPLLVTASAHYRNAYRKHCSSFHDKQFQFGKKPDQRTTLLYFSSSHTMGHRTSFVEGVQKALPSIMGNSNATTINKVVVKYPGANVSINVDRRGYTEVLSDAKYGAVLRGNVDETWRFTETLFCGAIPFLQKSVYDYYEPWLPHALMKLLPTYMDEADLQSKLKALSTTPTANYSEHSMAVRAAAQSWFKDLQTNLVVRIQQSVIRAL